MNSCCYGFFKKLSLIFFSTCAFLGLQTDKVWAKSICDQWLRPHCRIFFDFLPTFTLMYAVVIVSPLAFSKDIFLFHTFIHSCMHCITQNQTRLFPSNHCCLGVFVKIYECISCNLVIYQTIRHSYEANKGNSDYEQDTAPFSKVDTWENLVYCLCATMWNWQLMCIWSQVVL